MTETREQGRTLQSQRWQVHLGLLVTFVLSLAVLVVHTSLVVHELVGVIFAGYVVIHIKQRQRISVLLVHQLKTPGRWFARLGRMAWADAFLGFITANAILSGVADIVAGRPVFIPSLGPLPSIRWHSLSVIALLIFLTVHVVRRRRRLRASKIR